ncbi:MAG: lysophospholipid acyltransferase family protein [Pirellulales bacterium]
MPLRRTIDYVAYFALRVLVCIVQALPLEVCEQLASGLATLFTHVLPARAGVIAENLRTAFPRITNAEIKKLTWAMWRHLFLMGIEIAHAPRKIHRTNYRQYMRIPEIEQVVRIMLAGRPVVVISGHYGNFEMGGYLLGLLGFPTHSVARRLDNPYLDRFVNDFRRRTGQHILNKTGSGDQIERLLNSGGTLALLGDQHAGDKGCWVKFFGRPASTHKAVALFSLSFQAPTMVSYVRRRGGVFQYDLRCDDAIDPRDPSFQQGTVPLLSEWYTRCLERIIVAAPEQYWWVHRRWKGEPPKRKVKSRIPISDAA